LREERVVKSEFQRGRVNFDWLIMATSQYLPRGWGLSKIYFYLVYMDDLFPTMAATLDTVVDILDGFQD